MRSLTPLLGMNLYLSRWIFRISLDINYNKRPTQNYLCDKLKGFCVGNDAIWCKKWTTHLSEGSNQSIDEYIDVFMEIFLDDFTFFNELTHFEKFQKIFF